MYADILLSRLNYQMTFMETKHWIGEGINQWKQLFGGFNWYTWTFFQLEVEKENMAYGYEFIFIFIGLGFRIRYNTEKSLEQFEEWDSEMTELVSWDELMKDYDTKNNNS